MMMDRYIGGEGLMHGPEMPPNVEYSWWQSAPESRWENMILHPGNIKSIPVRHTHLAPTGAGIYMLFGDDGGLDYIGKSKCLCSRIRQHMLRAVDGRSADFGFFACLELPKHAYHDVEVAHIYAMEPPRNDLYELVRWDQHDAMVRAVQKAWGYEP